METCKKRLQIKGQNIVEHKQILKFIFRVKNFHTIQNKFSRKKPFLNVLLALNHLSLEFSHCYAFRAPLFRFFNTWLFFKLAGFLRLLSTCSSSNWSQITQIDCSAASFCCILKALKALWPASIITSGLVLSLGVHVTKFRHSRTREMKERSCCQFWNLVAASVP